MSGGTIVSFSHKTNFRVEFVGSDKGEFKELMGTIQEISTPYITKEIAPVAINKYKLQIAGTGVTFEPVMLRFAVDLELQTIVDLNRWIMDCFDQKSMALEGLGSFPKKPRPESLLIHMLNNDGDVLHTYRLVQPFVVSHSQLDYSYIEDGNPSVTTEAQVYYLYYQILRGEKVVFDAGKNL